MKIDIKTKWTNEEWENHIGCYHNQWDSTPWYIRYPSVDQSLWIWIRDGKYDYLDIPVGNLKPVKI